MRRQIGSSEEKRCCPLVLTRDGSRCRTLERTKMRQRDGWIYDAAERHGGFLLPRRDYKSRGAREKKPPDSSSFVDFIIVARSRMREWSLLFYVSMQHVPRDFYGRYGNTNGLFTKRPRIGVSAFQRFYLIQLRVKIRKKDSRTARDCPRNGLIFNA